MRLALGAGFGLLVLGAAVVGIVRWALRGAEQWYVGEGNGHRAVEEITVGGDV